jgi:hypothetical protein
MVVSSLKVPLSPIAVEPAKLCGERYSFIFENHGLQTHSFVGERMGLAIDQSQGAKTQLSEIYNAPTGERVIGSQITNGLRRPLGEMTAGIACSKIE